MQKITFDSENHKYYIDGVEAPSVTTVCRFLAYDQKSDKPWLAKMAAGRGTRVHEACAMIDYGEEPDEDAEISGYLKAYRRFLGDYRPQWRGIEYMAGSTAAGLAGTIDRWGRMDGHDCILDIKTGSRMHTAQLTAQLTGYARLLIWDQKDTSFVPTHLYGLQLQKDGTYFLKRYPIDTALLDACITMNHAVGGKAK